MKDLGSKLLNDLGSNLKSYLGIRQEKIAGPLEEGGHFNVCQPRISKASDRQATGSRTTGMTPSVKLTTHKYIGATATSTRVYSKPADQQIRIPYP